MERDVALGDVEMLGGKGRDFDGRTDVERDIARDKPRENILAIYCNPRHGEKWGGTWGEMWGEVGRDIRSNI